VLNIKSIAEGQKISILYAEDSPGLRMVTEAHLENFFEVESAGDGQEAFEKFIKNRDKFSLLLTDNDMPRCKGIDLTKRIRALKFNLPIIVYSGDTNLKQAVLSAGANFFIDKDGTTSMKDIVKIMRTFFITKL